MLPRAFSGAAPAAGSGGQRGQRTAEEEQQSWAGSRRAGDATYLNEVRRCACGAQASAPAGSTKRSGVLEVEPLLGRGAPREGRGSERRPAVSGSPSWALIQAMTAEKSAPSARIAARSITSPPEE